MKTKIELHAMEKSKDTMIISDVKLFLVIFNAKYGRFLSSNFAGLHIITLK